MLKIRSHGTKVRRTTRYLEASSAVRDTFLYFLATILTDIKLYVLHICSKTPLYLAVHLLTGSSLFLALSSPTIIIILLVYFIMETGSLMLLVLLRHIGQLELS